MTTDTLTVWTGADLADYLDEVGWTPEQVAGGLGYQVTSVKRWLATEDEPFGGNEERSHVLRLAILGLMHEGKAASAPASAPPLKLEFYVYPDDRVEVGKVRLARARRSRGTGQKSGPEYVEV